MFFLFSPCAVLSAESESPHEPRNCRLQTPLSLCSDQKLDPKEALNAHCGSACSLYGTCKTAGLSTKYGQSQSPRKCCFEFPKCCFEAVNKGTRFYLFVDCWFVFFIFLPGVHKKKDKFIAVTDETVTWGYHLSESSHICSPLQ